MREKDEIKSATKFYRFILIRIRFPEDVILQGMLTVYISILQHIEMVCSAIVIALHLKYCNTILVWN